MTKNLKILLLVLIVILLGAYITFYYISLPKSPSPPAGLTAEQKYAKLVDMSQSLTTPKQTSQLKAKLLEMSKSLNKKSQ